MKGFKIFSATIFIIIISVFCSGCSAFMDSVENQELRSYTEIMIDAIIAKDFDTAYSMIDDACSKDEFARVCTNMEVLLYDVESYKLEFTGVYKNINFHNGKTVNTLSATYKMTDNTDRVYIISVESNSEFEKLSYFEIQPYENTKLYSTGAINSMKDASPIQWVILLSNLVSIAVVIFAVIDCSRQKIKKKTLWLIIIILGLLTFGVTLSTSSLYFKLNISWFNNYSAFIKYGDGSMILRFMLPVGAIVYFIMRNHLIKKAATPPQPPVPPQPPYYPQYGAQPYQPTNTQHPTQYTLHNNPYQPPQHSAQQYGAPNPQTTPIQNEYVCSQTTNTDNN